MPTPTDSRLGPGLLKLGGTDYGVQIANVSLEPDQKSDDGTPTLGDPDPLPEVTETWTLKGSAIQDWEDPLGIVNYCMDNTLSVVAFEWTPNTDAATKWTGNVLITSLPIGGDVSAQNTSDFEWAVQGTPTRVDPPARRRRAPASSRHVGRGAAPRSRRARTTRRRARASGRRARPSSPVFRFAGKVEYRTARSRNSRRATSPWPRGNGTPFATSSRWGRTRRRRSPRS
jgi:hypothetical protein